jgi:ABC-type transport system involved in multi-copper enzyme maturation permease subunit
MLNVFKSEWMKLRHTKVFWMVLLCAIPSNLVAIFMLLPNMMLMDSAADIQDVFYRQGMVFTTLGPFMFALMTGYVFSREYQERTINQLFSYPEDFEPAIGSFESPSKEFGRSALPWSRTDTI